MELNTAKQKILAVFPGSVEMPDASGVPSADYCIMRPATKEDWPENKWVQIGPYVDGNPWEAALARLSEPFSRCADPQPTALTDAYWLIHYEDKSVPVEVYGGDGAEEAAKEIYAKRSTSWNCHLFVEYSAVETLLSRRTAEPKPAAEPPSNVLYEDSTGGLHCDLAVADAAEPSTAPSEEIMPLADVKWDAPVPAPSGDEELLELVFKAHSSNSFTWNWSDHFKKGLRAVIATVREYDRDHTPSHPPAEWLERVDKAIVSSCYDYGEIGMIEPNELANKVRARLTHKPVERVTVRLNGIKWEVRRDGSFMHEFIGSCAEELANALAAGLRAELAKESSDGK